LRMLFTRGRGTIATVEGEGIVMRMWDRPDAPPLFGIRKFSTGIDVGALGDSAQHVGLVNVTGLEINIPPKGERPDLRSAKSTADAAGREEESRTSVVIDRLNVKQATLVILPRDRAKQPLRFDIHDLKLQSAGAGGGLQDEAPLPNPTPPGGNYSFGSHIRGR